MKETKSTSSCGWVKYDLVAVKDVLALVTHCLTITYKKCRAKSFRVVAHVNIMKIVGLPHEVAYQSS